MDFSGPQPADFDNVQSLNRAFLLCLRETSCGRRMRQVFAPAVRLIIKGMSDLHVERLAATPFLLLSLRERDDDYWHDLSNTDVQDDLFLVRDTDAERGRLASAALAFLWQLARRNPYATRLVSGATLHWCEQLSDYTLLHLLQVTSRCEDLLLPRLANNPEFWDKLLGPGLSSELDVRRAAQLTALQSMLTEDPARRYQPTKEAACSTSIPSLRVAERNDRA
jgi:hypothetical protein